MLRGIIWRASTRAQSNRWGNDGQLGRKAIPGKGRRTRRHLKVLSLTVASLVLSVGYGTVAQAEPMPNGVPGTWQVKLNEEFSSSALNTGLWTPGWQRDGISSMSYQCVSPSLVSQPGDGYLHLWLHKEASTCEGEHSKEEKHEYTGSLVESNPEDGVGGHSGFHYSYGYVEWEAYITGIEAKCSSSCIPDWPALWILPGNHETETDIIEGLYGVAEYHFLPPFPAGIGGPVAGSFYGWHKYGVDWEPGVVTFYYDGTQVGQEKSEKINATPQYLVMDMVPPKPVRGHLLAPAEFDINYVRVWQHPTPPPPPPPTVTTSAASSVQEEEATLNGEVNGNGLNTTYHFEYGETTSYGSSTSPVEGGSGSFSPNATITGLQPGATYDYRLVATNSAGSTLGGNQTFTTAEAENIARWVMRDPVSGDQWAYFVGSAAGRRVCYWQSSPKWENNCLTGETVAEDTSPAVMRNSSSGEQWAYFVGSAAGRRVCYWQSSPKWENNCLTGETVAEDTSPAVMRNSSSGEQWAYFVGSAAGRRVCYWQSSPKWEDNCLTGETLAPDSSLSVVRDAKTGDQWVFFIGDGGGDRLCYWQSSPKWEDNCLTGETVAEGTSPTVVRDPTSGDQWAYFTGSGAGHRVCYWQSSPKWEDNCLTGETVAEGTSPTVVRDPTSGDQWAYFTGSGAGHRVCYWQSSPKWEDNCLTGETVAERTSPAAIREPETGHQWSFFIGSALGRRVCYWQEITSTWEENCLTGETVAAP